MPVIMKNRQKIIRVQLDADTGEDYLLLGVVSSEPDYKLSLAINRKMNLSLKHMTPVEVTDEKGSISHFSRFSDHSGKSGITFNLFSNKSDGELLLRKLNKIDYILQVYSPENDYDTEYITSSLRNIEAVTAVFTLEPGEIKDKNLQYLIP
jgi:hypothetical protein